MSVKAVKRYYSQICSQYKEMLENIKDLEREAEQGMIEPERIERLKADVAPIKQNYERWCYMMFLLNQPEKKSKVKKYEQQNSKLLNSLNKVNSLSAVIQENEDTLRQMGE